MIQELGRHCDWPDGQKKALTDMSYQLGSNSLNGFKQMQSAIKAGNYHQAAMDMGDSQYCRQVPTRCHLNQKLLHFY